MTRILFAIEVIVLVLFCSQAVGSVLNNIQKQKEPNDLFKSVPNERIIFEIKDSEPIPVLDFDVGTEYGFYYNINSFQLSIKIGALILTFNKPVDFSESNFKFTGKLKYISNSETNMNEFIPKETDYKEFNYMIDKTQSVTYFFIKETQKVMILKL